MGWDEPPRSLVSKGRFHPVTFDLIYLQCDLQHSAGTEIQKLSSQSGFHLNRWNFCSYSEYQVTYSWSFIRKYLKSSGQKGCWTSVGTNQLHSIQILRLIISFPGFQIWVVSGRTEGFLVSPVKVTVLGSTYVKKKKSGWAFCRLSLWCVQGHAFGVVPWMHHRYVQLHILTVNVPNMNDCELSK